MTGEQVPEEFVQSQVRPVGGDGSIHNGRGRSRYDALACVHDLDATQEIFQYSRLPFD